VHVPASSANLGPGFDVLALALDISNATTVLETESDLIIRVAGEGESDIPTHESNLFYRAMQVLFEARGHSPRGSFFIQSTNAIPLARGLGSSAATIVGGMLAARAIADLSVGDDELLDLAAALEGHPDNVAAALLGGCTLAVPVRERHWLARQLPWPERLQLALFVPDQALSTDAARAALPGQYSRSDAVHNLGNVALFLQALTSGDLDDLKIATRDRLHQPYRERLVPGLSAIIGAALDAGASGAFLSGAGPSVLALYDSPAVPGSRVVEAMAEAARPVGLTGRTLQPRVSSVGGHCDLVHTTRPPE
jgi:homoserine kinase